MSRLPAERCRFPFRASLPIVCLLELLAECPARNLSTQPRGCAQKPHKDSGISRQTQPLGRLRLAASQSRKQAFPRTPILQFDKHQKVALRASFRSCEQRCPGPFATDIELLPREETNRKSEP